jgi:4-diphosphocytidyl-2-C-methyl-D-erythritol kinase
LEELKIEAPAKINLFLEVRDKRSDGYHNVVTILEPVNLFDEIILRDRPLSQSSPTPPAGAREIKIVSEHPALPLGKENLAFQAASLLQEKFKIARSIQITIHKRIPLSSGLGGGSSDAAAVLLGLNKLWDLKLSYQQLLTFAHQLGADVPFFLRRKRALGKGRGDELELLPQGPKLYFILLSPALEISSEWAYKKLNYLTKKTQSIRMILPALSSGNIKTIGSNLYNSLEAGVISRYPVIAEIKKRLLELGACGALMSGSGSSVFGIAEDRRSAEKIYSKIKGDFERVFLLESLSIV